MQNMKNKKPFILLVCYVTINTVYILFISRLSVSPIWYVWGNWWSPSTVDP